MSNERKLRLIQVAKEFKVGLNTITDFLQKKGIKTDGSPNTLVEPDVYAVLEKEFGGSRITGNERESIRERISQKQATITLEEAQKQTREEEQEVIIKSNVISVKDELPQPKILGKIDLSPKPKPAPKPVSKPAAEPVPEAAAPKPQPAPQPAAPKTEAAPASETASAAKPEPEAAPKSDNIFRPAVQTLTGPQVLGTMDVSGFTPGNRHKRKRLSKEKVDVTRTPAGGPKPGSNGKSAAQPSRGQGPQSNQPRPGENKKTRKDKLKAPKPVVRPEISDEEVSKQVKDTLARPTSKNAKSKGSKYRKEKREAVAERMNEEFQREEQERSILEGHRIRDRSRAGYDDERFGDRGHHGLHEPGPDGVDQPTSRRRGARGRSRRVRLQDRIRIGGHPGSHRRRRTGQRGRPRAATADRNRHGTRRSR